MIKLLLIITNLDMRRIVTGGILLIAVNARFDTLEDTLRLPLDLRECNGVSEPVGESERRARIRAPKP